MKIKMTYQLHTCLDDLALLAAETGHEFDTFEYLDAVEQIHRDCPRCTPRREVKEAS